MSNSHVASSFVAGVVVAGKYRLTRQIGHGAMSVVFSAENLQTSGEVALKLLTRPDPELGPRLLREARACCQIRHKNVIQVLDVGQTVEGDPFLVMELLSGETLAELLERRRRLGQEEAAAVGRDVARALQAAHEKGVVHRDLKPANIFLHEQPGEDARVVKVLDFGVSKNLLVEDGLHTMLGAPIGSPMYMSPEQARAASDVDGRTDIWSLGVVLFEMITGARPFDGDAVEVIRSILHEDIPAISRRVRGIDPALTQWISACLRRDRDQRPWPASEIADQLGAFVTRWDRAQVPSCGAGPAPVEYAPRGHDPVAETETQPLQPPAAEAVMWPFPFGEVQLPPPPPEIQVPFAGGREPSGDLHKAFLETVRLPPAEAPELPPAASTEAPLVRADDAPPEQAEPTGSTPAAKGAGVRRTARVIALVTAGLLAVSLMLAGLLLRVRPRTDGGTPATTAIVAEPLAPPIADPAPSPPSADDAVPVAEPRIPPVVAEPEPPASVPVPSAAPAAPKPPLKPTLAGQRGKCGRFIRSGCTR